MSDAYAALLLDLGWSPSTTPGLWRSRTTGERMPLAEAVARATLGVVRLAGPVDGWPPSIRRRDFTRVPRAV